MTSQVVQVLLFDVLRRGRNTLNVGGGVVLEPGEKGSALLMESGPSSCAMVDM